MKNCPSETVLRETMREVERDEAEVFRSLSDLLAKIQLTGMTMFLESICDVLKDWQNEPPKIIGGRLKEITDRLDRSDER